MKRFFESAKKSLTIILHFVMIWVCAINYFLMDLSPFIDKVIYSCLAGFICLTIHFYLKSSKEIEEPDEVIIASETMD